MKIPESLKSRKFWMAILSAAVVFCNEFFGWDLKIEQIIAIVAPILAYITVEGIADIKSRKPGK